MLNRAVMASLDKAPSREGSNSSRSDDDDGDDDDDDGGGTMRRGLRE